MNHLVRIWKNKDLRKKILFTLFIILILRAVAHITVPGVDPRVLEETFQSGGALSIFAALTGGSMERFSIVMMGLSPYINASIIVQLMTVAIPKLEAISKEGDQGRKKINSITRWLTYPLAFLQSYGMIALIAQSTHGVEGAFIDYTNPAEVLPAMITISTGTLLLVWLGELISEKGIGNGISMIIFAGIVSSMPSVFGNMLLNAELGNTGKILPFILFVAFTVLLLMIVVVFTDAHKAIPITHTSRSAKGGKSVLPIRVLQAGMIPIIFSVSMITFPSVLAQFLRNADYAWVQKMAEFWNIHFNSGNPTPEYLALYFILIVAFTYFYVSITFNPENVAENLQKRGGFIAGRRPGKETAEYLGYVSNRMNLWGGFFLGAIALVPIVFTMFTDLTSSDLIISGSGLIIVVGVVLELIRQVNAQLAMHDYDKLA
jgi:preprotein translocase subunit SecY